MVHFWSIPGIFKSLLRKSSPPPKALQLPTSCLFLSSLRHKHLCSNSQQATQWIRIQICLSAGRRLRCRSESAGTSSWEQSQLAGLQEVSPPGQHLPLWQTATKACCLLAWDQTQQVVHFAWTRCCRLQAPSTQNLLVQTVMGRVSLSTHLSMFYKSFSSCLWSWPLLLGTSLPLFLQLITSFEQSLQIFPNCPPCLLWMPVWPTSLYSIATFTFIPLTMLQAA